MTFFKRNHSQGHIVVVYGSTWEMDELICLDTTRMKNGECPAVQYKLKDDKILSVADCATDFWEVFNKENEAIYLEKGIPREQEEAGDRRELPLGMGFGQCWMVIEGASGKAIQEAFLQDKPKKYEYREGLQKVVEAEKAIQQVGINVEQYPYKKVTVGELIT